MSTRNLESKRRAALSSPHRNSSHPPTKATKFNSSDRKKQKTGTGSDFHQSKTERGKGVHSILFSAKDNNYSSHISPIRNTKRNEKPIHPFFQLKNAKHLKHKQGTVCGSTFVACPLQCGKHIALHCLNAHLDICDGDTVPNDKSLKSQDRRSLVKPEISNYDKNCVLDHPPTNEESPRRERKIRSGDTNNPGIDEVSSQNDSSSRIPSPVEPFKSPTIYEDAKHNFLSKIPGYENVFGYMMKCSQFKSMVNTPIQQQFRLTSINGKYILSWETINSASNPKISSDLGVIWSTTTLIKTPQQKHNDPQINENYCKHGIIMFRDVELVVSTSIPSDSDSSIQLENPMKQKEPYNDIKRIQKPGHPLRLVKKHSTLSVAVLKSMLQKNVRRRRPLPSVRVAMELADKSWSDLIRRIPIIMLEDSTLHPDLPFLVWLMVADSKGFIPSEKMIFRVMEIIFEIASCPWKDHASQHQTNDSSSEDENIDLPLNLNLVHPVPWHPHMDQTAELYLRVMLLRRQYGGMSCDISLLTDFVQTWRIRFQQKSQIISAEVRKRWNIPNFSDGDGDTNMTWTNLPKKLNQVWQTKSEKYVRGKLFADVPFLEKLQLTDMCLAGVDFHCSNILEAVLFKESHFLGNIHDSQLFYKEFYNHLTNLEKNDMEELFTDIRMADTDKCELKRKQNVLKVAKSCMWRYSSGINLRQPLLPLIKTDKPHDTDKMKELWEGILQVPLDKFALDYLKKRLL